MTACVFCQGTIDMEHSARVDRLYDALGAAVDESPPGSREYELLHAVYALLAGLRWLPSYGEEYRPYGYPFPAHRGCYEDWSHDQEQDRAMERAAEQVDDDAAMELAAERVAQMRDDEHIRPGEE